MHVRIIAAGFVAASLIAAPALAVHAAQPSSSSSTTTTTDVKKSDTDASGKTVTKHHVKGVKKHASSKPAAADNTAGQ